MQWLLLAIPWLNPSTYGPTHAVGQGLLSWFAAALCGLLWQWARTRQDAQARTVALAWALAAGLSALMGLLQYLGLAQHFPGLIDSLDAGQAYANLRQRNQLATLLAIGLCAVLYVAHQPALRQGSAAVRAGVHGLLAVLVVVLASADAASGSRTGMLQLLLVFGLALRWRRGLGFSALALLAYAAAAVLLPLLAGLDPLHSGILGRVSEGASPCNSRLTLWSNVLELIAQRPWWGWGWGELAYAHFMHLYAGPRFCEILGNAHNLPLHLAVTLGLPLALLLCTAACWGVWRAQPWRETDPQRQMAWGVLAVIGLHSLVEYPLWYGPFQVAALLSLYLLWRSPSSDAPAQSGVAPRWHRRIVLLLPLLLLGACAYAGWDYWRISQIYLPVNQRAASYRDHALELARDSWLFQSQVQFAELGITPLEAGNAAHLYALAEAMLHFSPEASVAQKLVDSALLLGRDAEAHDIALRFKAAFPQDYADWKQSQPLATRDKTP